MASAFKQQRLLLLVYQIFSLLSLFHSAFAAENLTSSVQEQPLLMQYHHGPLLTGQISVNLIWYGNFSSSQRATVTDFISSVSSSTSQNQPSVDTWWKAIENYYSQSKTKPPSLLLQNQILDENYSLGKSLEAATACLGIYGKGAYPGYAGKLLVDSSTGASYNAYGANGRKYLLPALFDPSTSTCLTLV